MYFSTSLNIFQFLQGIYVKIDAVFRHCPLDIQSFYIGSFSTVCFSTFRNSTFSHMTLGLFDIQSVNVQSFYVQSFNVQSFDVQWRNHKPCLATQLQLLQTTLIKQ
jgi:hypothetical protein